MHVAIGLAIGIVVGAVAIGIVVGAVVSFLFHAKELAAKEQTISFLYSHIHALQSRAKQAVAAAQKEAVDAINKV